MAKEAPGQERLRHYEFGPFRLDPTERMLLRDRESGAAHAESF